MRIGEMEVTVLDDGCWRLEPTAMYGNTAEDWLPHRQFLDEDGMLPCQLGGFLVRSGDRLVLVDTGAGPSSLDGFGRLMDSLGAAGHAPTDITDVVLTHLHFDHVGWTSDGERAIFPNATYRCDERDWGFFVGPDGLDESYALSMLGGLSATERLSPVAPRFETWSTDTAIAPGIDLRTAPPGSADPSPRGRRAWTARSSRRARPGRRRTPSRARRTGRRRWGRRPARRRSSTRRGRSAGG